MSTEAALFNPPPFTGEVSPEATEGAVECAMARLGRFAATPSVNDGR